MTHAELPSTLAGPADPTPFWPSMSPAIGEAWRAWQYHADASQDAEGRSDSVTAVSERRLADDAARQLAEISSLSMDDIAPKVVVLAWLQCHGADVELLAIIEDVITAESMALQPRIDLD